MCHSCKCCDSPDPVKRFNNVEAEAAAITLLSDLTWRVRTVERIELQSASWTDRKKSIHVEPLQSWLPEELQNTLEEHHTHARLFLPIGNFPRGALLDFSVTVADQAAFLLPRNDQALIRAHYVEELARRANITWDKNRVIPLLQAIFGFATEQWKRNLQQESSPSDAVLQTLLWKYLNEVGIPGWAQQDVDYAMVQRWNELVDQTRSVVRKLIAKDRISAAEHPILALPHATGITLNSEQAVVEHLSALNDLLVAADIAPSDNAASKTLLNVYAIGGSHWDAITEVVVPLKEPFMIKTCEKREVGLKRGPGWTKSSHQIVSFNDAYSTHLNIRVADTNVEMKVQGARVLNERNNLISGSPDFQRATPELFTLNSARPNRPHYVVVSMPLKASLPARVSRFVILALTASALIAFCFFLFNWLGAGGGRDMTAGDVAVILVPSAIAASLLLVRETSTLSTEINEDWSITTGLILLILWISTLIAYGFNGIEWGR
jgi:hypothetical protein